MHQDVGIAGIARDSAAAPFRSPSRGIALPIVETAVAALSHRNDESAVVQLFQFRFVASGVCILRSERPALAPVFCGENVALRCAVIFVGEAVGGEHHSAVERGESLARRNEVSIEPQLILFVVYQVGEV